MEENIWDFSVLKKGVDSVADFVAALAAAVAALAAAVAGTMTAVVAEERNSGAGNGAVAAVAATTGAIKYTVINN
jgi:hypothetical protein